MSLKQIKNKGLVKTWDLHASNAQQSKLHIHDSKYNEEYLLN